MAQRIVGIDLGSYSVKVVTLSPRSKPSRPGGLKQAFEVVGFGESIVPAAVEGSDAASSLRSRQSEALGDLKRRGLLEGDVYVTGLSVDAAAVKTLLFPFSDKEKIAEVLPYTLESEIALDLGDVVWSWAQLPPKDKSRKESQVLCAFARKEAVQEVLDVLAVHGIDPRHVEFDALALDDLWDGLFAATHGTSDGPSTMGMTTHGGTLIETAEGAPQPAIAVVDIGHRRTSVCVLHEGNVISAHTVLHGGSDATRALARDIGLPLDEAERGKRKEAFLEVAGAVAQFPEQKQISDVLKKAYSPIVRRLRQIFQATISSSRLRVVKVVITGGGSKVMNLDRHLAEELNIKVARGREVGATLRTATQLSAQNPFSDNDDGTESALAFAYALSGIAGSRTRARIDFRVGPFAWAGDYDFFRERLPALGAWAATLLLVVGVGSVAQLVMLSREASALQDKKAALCQQITGEAPAPGASADACLAAVRQRIDGTAGFKVPEQSAVDVFIEISRRLPYASEFPRKITELDITSERVRLRGTTTSYDVSETMVERLKKGKCFQMVEKTKTRNINDSTLEMNITINLDCATAPGDGQLPPPPPSPTAASLKASSSTPSSSSSSSSSSPSSPVTDTKAPPYNPTLLGLPAAPATPVSPRSEELEGDRGVRPSNEEAEARKDRLKRLREEREARRRQLLDNPVVRPNLRDRFQKPGGLPLDRPEIPAGDE